MEIKFILKKFTFGMMGWGMNVMGVSVVMKMYVTG